MPSPPAAQFCFASDHSLLVSFGNEISEKTYKNVRSLSLLLLEGPRKGILNVHPAYASVLISFDPRIVTPSDMEKHIRDILSGIEETELPPSRLVDIPVCYDADLGPDLEYVAAYNRISREEVIRMHSAAVYRVFFLGFQLGFPHLGGMSGKIATPRRETPLLSIPGGSVAIGGVQTGIYPKTSPGGWRIIGRTPLELFNPESRTPTMLEMGDSVKFVPTSRQDFHALEKLQKS